MRVQGSTREGYHLVFEFSDFVEVDNNKIEAVCTFVIGLVGIFQPKTLVLDFSHVETLIKDKHITCLIQIAVKAKNRIEIIGSSRLEADFNRIDSQAQGLFLHYQNLEARCEAQYRY